MNPACLSSIPMIFRLHPIIVIAGLVSMAGLCSAQHPAVKPGKLKVVQCWDDSLSTDIPLVALLKKHHAKATFNIIPNETRRSFVVKKLRIGPHVCFSFLSKAASSEGGFTVEHLANREMPEIYKGFKIVSGHLKPASDGRNKPATTKQRGRHLSFQQTRYNRLVSSLLQRQMPLIFQRSLPNKVAGSFRPPVAGFEPTGDTKLRRIAVFRRAIRRKIPRFGCGRC